VEARAADDAIIYTERNEPVLEFAHLERGAHEDRNIVEVRALDLQGLDLVADRARFLARVPRAGDGDFLAVLSLRAQGLAEPVPIVADEVRGRAEDMRIGAVVTLQPDHFRAREILLETQNVVDL